MIILTLLWAFCLCAATSAFENGDSHWVSHHKSLTTSFGTVSTTSPLAFSSAEVHALDARKKKKNPKPSCNIEGDSPFDSCNSNKRDYLDDTEEDANFSEPSPTGEAQKRDPKKKKSKPKCNIENDSPFESCKSDKRDDENNVKQDFVLAMVKRASYCPQDHHFLTAQHGTYHYWFCCPVEPGKMLLPENYAAAPKCCKKSDKTCKLDAVDSLDGCGPGEEVTNYGGVVGCRIRATKKDKREAALPKTGITAGHDPVTSLGPDSDLHPTTYPVAPPDHGQYCHFGGCGKGKVTSYDGPFCQCVPAPPPTPITVTVHDAITGFISDVVGRDVEATQTMWKPAPTAPVPKIVTSTTTVFITVGAPTATVAKDFAHTEALHHSSSSGTKIVTITVPYLTTMSTAISPSTTAKPSTMQDSIKALGKSRLS